jgi:DNA gyrase subunit A
MYATGRGRVVMRAKVVKEALRGGKEQLVVTELPYTISKSKLIEQIADLARRGKAEALADIRDETDRDGIRLVIELKRGADAGKALRDLYHRTSLQSTFGAILLALDGGQPRDFNLKELLERFRDHRLEVIRRRSQFDLERAETERHVVEGLLVALKHIDEVVKIIRGAKDRSDASDRLQDRFGLSENQADAILDMRLAKLTALERSQLKARLAELQSLIADLRRILKSEERQLEVMLEELGEVVKRHGNPRRTVILTDDEVEDEGEPELEDQIADEDVVVTVSHEGFVKRIPMHLYRRRMSSGKALADMERHDDDYLERVFVARTRGWILALTERGHCHFLRVLDVPESARASRGQSAYSLLGAADRKDRVVAMIPVEDLAASGRYLVFVSRLGVIKRTSLVEFANPRAGGLIAAGVKKGDRIRDVTLSDGLSEVLLLSSGGRAVRFAESEVPSVGRSAQGVKGMELKETEQVVGVVRIRREANILTVTEDGVAKRIPVGEFPLQKRGGMGNLVTPSSGEGSPIVAALEVLDSDEVMIVTGKGQVTRIAVDAVPLQGRRSQGRKLVKLSGGDRVAEVTRTEGEEGAPAAAPLGDGQLDLL